MHLDHTFSNHGLFPLLFIILKVIVWPLKCSKLIIIELQPYDDDILTRSYQFFKLCVNGQSSVPYYGPLSKIAYRITKKILKLKTYSKVKSKNGTRSIFLGPAFWTVFFKYCFLNSFVIYLYFNIVNKFFSSE